jgi:hypothetical protein
MEAFSGVLGALGKLGGGLGQGVSALGPLTSLFGMVNQFSQAQKQKALVDRSIYYSKHPEVVANLEKQYEKPLSSGLTSSISNVVNANLAEQGLSQAPGIQSQVLSQALAPYQQQEQQFALQEAFKALGLPSEALAAMNSGQQPNLANMLKYLLPSGSTSPFGSVGGLSDPALGTPSYIPGGGGPTLTAPDIGTTDAGGIDLGGLLGGGGSPPSIGIGG